MDGKTFMAPAAELQVLGWRGDGFAAGFIYGLLAGRAQDAVKLG